MPAKPSKGSVCNSITPHCKGSFKDEISKLPCRNSLSYWK